MGAVCVWAGGCSGGATWVCLARRLQHIPDLGFSVLQETLKPLRKKQELLQHLSRLGLWGTSSKVAKTRGPPSILSLLHFPICLFHRDHKELRQLQPLWRCPYSSGCLFLSSEAQTQMSKPLYPCLHPELPVFHTNLPTLVSSFYIFVGRSLTPKWIFPFISHLLYLPPPLAHFSSSLSSCLFSFFYNPVYLDNFHLDCLT